MCDAVDAMLSDRPYRKALAIEEVRRQLIAYTDEQFDAEVVEVTTKSSLLEEFAEMMRQSESPQPSKMEIKPTKVTARVG